MMTEPSSTDQTRIDRILDLWFEKRELTAPQIDARLDVWFGEDPELDIRLRHGFADDIREASQMKLMHWAETPRGRLALIIAIDQFRRNVYRGTARAFSHDNLALKLCVEGVVRQADRQLTDIERVFMYMPMQHAEHLRVQKKSVMVFNALASRVSPTLRETFRTFADFAELHHDIVERFGRFPHRNRILGREDTPEEREYLGSDAPTFGQSVGADRA
ncbi:MAG: DUF924 domain-containing protein [Gammaproteobacteria bacterium]|jgi:uncharacterized protein (DUF924 family)